MKSTFSIIATFLEALHLGIRYSTFLVVVTLLVAIPSIIWEYLTGILMRSDPLLVAVLALPAAVVLFVISAMKMAAILGVLKSPQKEVAIWRRAIFSMRTYLWTFIQLSLLLMVMAWVLIVPVSFFIAFSGKIIASSHNYLLQLLLVFLAILYLVFIKFALAGPLVVVEEMGAVDALKRSWEMTKGHFGYVFGCYVFLGAVEYFIGTEFGRFTSPEFYGYVDILREILSSLLACLWILMAWCMYWRIKGHEAELTPVEIPAN